jgi:hypothetical protein
MQGYFAVRMCNRAHITEHLDVLQDPVAIEVTVESGIGQMQLADASTCAVGSQRGGEGRRSIACYV